MEDVRTTKSSQVFLLHFQGMLMCHLVGPLQCALLRERVGCVKRQIADTLLCGEELCIILKKEV